MGLEGGSSQKAVAGLSGVECELRAERKEKLSMQTFGRSSVPVQRPWGKRGEVEKSMSIGVLNSVTFLLCTEEKT